MVAAVPATQKGCKQLRGGHSTIFTREMLYVHWLRVPERVRYKLCLLVFKAVHGTAPDYLSELCRSNAEDTARSRLRSPAHSDLQVTSWNEIIRSKTALNKSRFFR